MARFAITVTATQPVTTEVIVDAEDEDQAYEMVSTLFDRFVNLDWEPDGSPVYEDVENATEVDEDWALTPIRD